jgi:hypothetical protein
LAGKIDLSSVMSIRQSGEVSCFLNQFSWVSQCIGLADSEFRTLSGSLRHEKTQRESSLRASRWFNLVGRFCLRTKLSPEFGLLLRVKGAFFSRGRKRIVQL